MSSFKRFLAALTLSFAATSAIAQTDWPSPEVEQMYNQARQFNAQGNLKQAITLYQQAIQIAPQIMILHRELGQAYYYSGQYTEAKATLEPVIASGEADEGTYQVMGSTLSSEGETKKAKKTFEQGLVKFPHSGLLYHELGVMYDRDKQPEKALEAWLKGIEEDPAYHINYYEAAHSYIFSTKPVWAVLYGEMFVNLEQKTPRSYETRKMILAGYKKILRPTGEIPKYGQDAVVGPETFETAVTTTLKNLAPVTMDGMSTENLIMLRTRFMMEWQKTYARKYPYSLFARQDDLIRNGYFDIYNQWLFGKIEDEQTYEAWNKFHPDAMPDMEEWFREHPYHPVAGDFYNDKNISRIFPKKED